MELRLSEELFLVAFNEKRGTFAPFRKEYFKYGVAAALLQELIALQKMELNGEKLSIIRGESFGDKLLDPVLNFLYQPAKKKKVFHWISRLGLKYGKFKKIILEELIDKGVLRPRQESGTHEDEPSLFRLQRFKIWDEMPFHNLHKRLHDILLHGREPDPNTLKLIGLIYGCKLTRQVFTDKEDYKQIMLRINTVTEGDIFKKSIRSVVNSNRLSALSGLFSIGVMILKETC